MSKDKNPSERTLKELINKLAEEMQVSEEDPLGGERFEAFNSELLGQEDVSDNIMQPKLDNILKRREDDETN